MEISQSLAWEVYKFQLVKPHNCPTRLVEQFVSEVGISEVDRVATWSLLYVLGFCSHCFKTYLALKKYSTQWNEYQSNLRSLF